MLTKLRPVTYRQELYPAFKPDDLRVRLTRTSLVASFSDQDLSLQTCSLLLAFLAAAHFYKRSSFNRNVRQAQTFRQGTDCHAVGGFVFLRFAGAGTSINVARYT